MSDEKTPWIRFWWGRPIYYKAGRELGIGWQPYTPALGEGYYRYKRYLVITFNWPFKARLYP